MDQAMPTSPASYIYPAITPAEAGLHPTSPSVTFKTENEIAEGPVRKKQKRNKPTLSCEECVERKTKCDRSRPDCIACEHVVCSRLIIFDKTTTGVKRQTECVYAAVANLHEDLNHSTKSAKRMTKPPKRRASLPSNSFETPKQVANVPPDRSSRGSTSSSIGLLSNVPYSHPTASNVFGIGSEHPFANYWTCQGGLSEVISVLPEKIQADILLERYFECVDPVYPMIDRLTFYADYEYFWSLSPPEKDTSDGTLVALIFSMISMGTQFISSTHPLERQQTAEFYVSAAHQALRMASYLNKPTMRSIQSMVLITYFLINDNHASDGWAFAGALVRQAYAMGLHRDPNIVCPTASIFDKQQRRKLWQAVLLQDTFLTVLLSLPPSATHTDVKVEDLTDDAESIAHSNPVDTSYIRGCWTLANLVQETICSPRSLDMPICTSPRQKTKLLADFKNVFRAFPVVFREWDERSLKVLAILNKRVVRQTLFLTSNYWHNVMLLHSCGIKEGDFGVEINVRGTLEAAHDAIQSFFLLWEIFESEAKVWWVFNHRAFLEALCIGGILQDEAKKEGGMSLVASDPLFVRGKADITRMIEIMQQMSEGEHGSAVALTRVSVLSTYL